MIFFLVVFTHSGINNKKHQYSLNRNYKLLSVIAFASLLSVAAINQASALSLGSIPILGDVLASATGLALGPTPIPGNLIPAPSTPPTIITPPQLPLLPPISIPALFTVSKVQSGLVVSDSLTNETMNKEQLLANQKYWKYNGSAEYYQTPYDLSKDSQGLHLGVQSPSTGEWRGIYAVSPNTDATLFHSVITTDRRTNPPTVPSTFYENGLYVQTAAITDVNYVVCTSDTSSFGTVWAVFSATGNSFGATDFKQLWVDTSADQPLTRDCTIITNGDNYLKVYMDGIPVFESNTLDLKMPGPFNAFLEPQTSYAGDMQYGVYKDYYATKGETVKVTNTPPLAATVKLVDSTNHELASAPVQSGSATLSIGKYHMPLQASIVVYDANGIALASTPSTIGIFGGDVYSVKLNLNLGI